MKVTIIGIQPMSFTPNGQTEKIEGSTIYYEEELPARNGAIGKKGDKCFLTSEKLKNLDFTPMPGQIVTLLFNRYGTVMKIQLESEGNEIIDY